MVSDTTSLEAKCSCGAIHFAFDIPTRLLPLPTYICHCSICRYATGAPCIFHAVLPRGILPKFIVPSTEKNLTSYQPAQDCTYDFCSTCGCHVAGVSFDRHEWTISTSMFLHHGPNNFEITTHVFSKSAPGGAIPAVVSKIGKREMSHYNPAEDDARSAVKMPTIETGPNGDDQLRAQCHCGGVSFTFGRPTQEVLIDKFVSGFVSPRDKKKWMAIYDVCNDCRFATGSHVSAWTFIPLSLCNPPIRPDLKIGTSKTYSSSKGVLRSFCGKCGATVFFSCDERNPMEEKAVVDIAMGILRCPDGVMGEDWFTWRARLAYEESGVMYDEGFGTALREGMKAWSMEKYGEILTLNIG